MVGSIYPRPVFLKFAETKPVIFTYHHKNIIVLESSNYDNLYIYSLLFENPQFVGVKRK